MLQSGPVGVLMSAFAFVEGLRAHAIVLFNRRSRAGDLLLNCEDIPNLAVRALRPSWRCSFGSRRMLRADRLKVSWFATKRGWLWSGKGAAT